MDAVPNPTNSPYLDVMRIILVGSADGVQRLGMLSAASEGTPYVVPNGSCATIKRIRVGDGGMDGAQCLLLEPGARHVIIAALYGPPEHGYPLEFSNAACPSFEEIARTVNRPQCVLRVSSPLE
jgi:hypothetical protein